LWATGGKAGGLCSQPAELVPVGRLLLVHLKTGAARESLCKAVCLWCATVCIVNFFIVLPV
jgi:hypothetical protein